MNKLVLCGMVAAACMINGAALAHGGDHMDGWQGSDKKMMKMGKHWMEGKVESVDHKTGWVKVKTGEGDLNLHFPPDSVKDLKEGETITVYLSFTKGEKRMMDREKTDKPMKDGTTK